MALIENIQLMSMQHKYDGCINREGYIAGMILFTH